MSLSLHTIKSSKGSRKTRKRVGRGLGSTGRYSGRGIKGQRSRSGGRSGLRLKGLRAIMLNLPKNRGFKSPNDKYELVQIGDLHKSFSDGAKVTPSILLKKGLIEKIGRGVKVLAKGEISRKLQVEECLVSSGAKKKIEDAGGSVVEKTKK